MTQREADLGKRRRYADDRGFVGWVPSLTTPPSSPGWSHVHSLLGAAYHERFGFPCQNLYGSCASRPNRRRLPWCQCDRCCAHACLPHRPWSRNRQNRIPSSGSPAVHRETLAFTSAPGLVGGEHLWRVGSDRVWVLTVALVGGTSVSRGVAAWAALESLTRPPVGSDTRLLAAARVRPA
jgi:hypothetical protein